MSNARDWHAAAVAKLDRQIAATADRWGECVHGPGVTIEPSSGFGLRIVGRGRVSALATVRVNELPLTRSEAFAVVRHWQYHQFPGTPCPGIAEELEGQPETLVMRLLDEWAATNDRPPTGDEFRARLHRVTRAEAIDRHRANARARTKAS